MDRTENNVNKKSTEWLFRSDKSSVTYPENQIITSSIMSRRDKSPVVECVKRKSRAVGTEQITPKN